MLQRRAAAAVRASQRQLDAIVNDQSDIVCRFDAAGRLLFANEACRRLFDPQGRGLEGTSWQSIVAPQDLPPVLDQLARIRPEAPTAITENRILPAAGGWRWVQFTNTGFFDAAGQLREVQCVGRDTTERKALEQRLQETGERLQDLYDHAPCGYYSLDAQGRFVHINATALGWLGCDREEVVGRLGPRDFFTAEGIAEFNRSFPRFMAQGHIGPLEFDLLSRDGSTRRISVEATALRDEQGTFLMSRSVMFDVTELDRVRRELQRANREQAAMLNSGLVGIARVRDRVQLWVNPELARMFQYRPEEMVGAPTRVLYPDDAAYRAFGAACYPVLERGETYRTQTQLVRKDGTPVWVDISGTRLTDDGKESMWLMLDITEMKRHEEQIEKLASYDALTGLPNRLLLADRLRQGLLLAQRLQSRLAVCFLDLDGFKAVNDTQGHEAGDQLLRVIAQRLHACVRGNDTVARLGGDEFVLLLGNLSGDEEARAILERALQAVGEAVLLGPGVQVRVSGSIGVACYPQHADTTEHLLARADAAMYQAKRAGRNRIHFA